MVGPVAPSSHLLRLFGHKGSAAAMPAEKPRTIADLARTVEELAPRKAASPGTAAPPAPEGSEGVGARLPIVVPEGHVLETREQYEAKVAKARAEMEAWEASEQAFEKENGFRRQVNSMLQGSYDAALSGQFGAWSFDSHKDAQEFAMSRVSGVWGQLVTANSDSKTLATPEWIDQMAKNRDLTGNQMTAKLEDERKAAQMNMFMEAMLLNKSLEVSGGPLYAKQDGYAYMNNVEIRHEGRLVLTVEEHGGKITLWDEDGTARDYGRMHQIAQNQPGSYARAP